MTEKKKRIKRVLPKVLAPAMIADLERWSSVQLGSHLIAANLKCSVDEFNERKETDPVFAQALLRGKATVIENCAMVVVLAAQGTKDQKTQQPIVTEMQLRAAQFYLEHHAPEWLRE